MGGQGFGGQGFGGMGMAGGMGDPDHSRYPMKPQHGMGQSTQLP